MDVSPISPLIPQNTSSSGSSAPHCCWIFSATTDLALLMLLLESSKSHVKTNRFLIAVIWAILYPMFSTKEAGVASSCCPYVCGSWPVVNLDWSPMPKHHVQFWRGLRLLVCTSDYLYVPPTKIQNRLGGHRTGARRLGVKLNSTCPSSPNHWWRLPYLCHSLCFPPLLVVFMRYCSGMAWSTYVKIDWPDLR
jgi:hypothetical protein